MYIEAHMIVTAASLFGALATIFTAIFGVYKWYLRQNEVNKRQNEEINNIKQEQGLIVEGLLACLDGLEQLGCNHTVPKTKVKIAKHINDVAHSVDKE